MMAANDVGRPMGYWETVQLPVSASVWVPHWSFAPLSLVRVGSHRMWLFLCFLGFLCVVWVVVSMLVRDFFLWCYIGRQISSDVEFLSLIIIVVDVYCLCFPRVSGNQLSCAPQFERRMSVDPLAFWWLECRWAGQLIIPSSQVVLKPRILALRRLRREWKRCWGLERRTMLFCFAHWGGRRRGVMRQKRRRLRVRVVNWELRSCHCRWGRKIHRGRWVEKRSCVRNWKESQFHCMRLNELFCSIQCWLVEFREVLFGPPGCHQKERGPNFG